MWTLNIYIFTCASEIGGTDFIFHKTKFGNSKKLTLIAKYDELNPPLYKMGGGGMACNGVLTPPSKSNPCPTPNWYPSSVLKFLTPTQSSNFLLPSSTGNKKHEDMKLMHKPLIQYNPWQIKKQSEIWRNIYNKPNTNLNI